MSGNLPIKVIEEIPVRQTSMFRRAGVTDNNIQRLIQADQAFESAGLGAWSFDFEANILKICLRCKKMLGIPDAQATAIGLLISLIPKDQAPALIYAIRTAMEKSTPIDLQFPVNRDEPAMEQQQWLRITGIVEAGSNGKAKRLYGTLADISPRMQREISRQDLMALISHEMKSPLSSIKLYVQLCQSIVTKTEEDRLLKFLNSANEMVDKADQMLDYFLKGPTMQTGQLSLAMAGFNMHDLLIEMVDQVQFRHPEHQLILRNSPAMRVQADRERIGQVVENLLTNAIKYSPDPDVIVINCKMSKDHLQVSIKDHGIGIPSNEHYKIFDKYYRVDNQLEKPVGGFGIGLYLCKTIIEGHHGKIWFKSELNKGTTFFFRLPVA